MDGSKRANIKIGAQVAIVLKQDQGSGDLTEGMVELPHPSPWHKSALARWSGRQSETYSRLRQVIVFPKHRLLPNPL
jgi:hypothetical protein